MKIAFFNIQNIFHRHIDLAERYNAKNTDRWMGEFEALLAQPERSPADHERMRALSRFLGFENEGQAPCFTIRSTMGRLQLKKGMDRKMPRATKLTHWNGWAKVSSMPIDDVAVQNKAKVIGMADPDILVLLEVEDRPSLVGFNKHFLRSKEKSPYTEIVFLGTNDPYDRGIGVLAKRGYGVQSIKTHVNDVDNDGKPIFDMDLQEYEIKTPKEKTLHLLATCTYNHPECPQTVNEKQKMQAKRIASVYGHLRGSKKYIVLASTLNAPSYSDVISPILETDLRDIAKHCSFDVDLDRGKDSGYFRMGAYKMGVNIKQKDYLMLSPGLFGGVQNSGLLRKGIWCKKQPQWDMLKSIKNEAHMASEHPLIWAQFK